MGKTKTRNNSSAKSIDHKGYSSLLDELSDNLESASENLKLSLEKISTMAATAVDVERCGIWIYDFDHVHLNCFDLYDKNTGRHSAGIEFHKQDCPNFFESLSKDEPIEGTQLTKKTKELARIYYKALHITKVLYVPIHKNGELIGVMSFENVDRKRDWLDRDQDFAQHMADLVGRVFQVHSERQAQLIAREMELNPQP